MRRANVYTIPAASSFLDVFVDSILDGRIIDGYSPRGDGVLLSKATIFVPNRRTARALALAFLARSDQPAQLLPKIKTLGDIDDDHFGLVENATDLDTDLQVVGNLERKLELAKLVQRWVDALSAETRRLYDDEDIFIPSSQADAIRLSDDLCALLDQVTQEEIKWSAIQNSVPEEHTEWWGITATFLNIIMQNWPTILAEQGLIDSSLKARNMIDRRIERYQSEGSSEPVIIAGSTGSVPATRRFLQTVAKFPQGAIILPGLDTAMPADEWKALHQEPAKSTEALESHPQFGLAKLLASIGLERDEVGELVSPDKTLELRSRVISNVLSLPSFAGAWQKTRSQLNSETLEAAFKDVALIEAANERQEAISIAIALRETLESPDKTAALVTPDRNLARRVGVELKRFGIEVDDTAGRPLRETSAALFVRQLIRYCFADGSKSEFASLLKSPFFRLGLPLTEARQSGEAIERYGLRGAIGKPGCGVLLEFLQNRFAMDSHLAMKNDDSVLSSMLAHATQIDEALLPIADLVDRADNISLSEYISALAETLSIISSDESGNNTLDNISGITELNNLFSEILQNNAGDFEIHPHDFSSVFEALIDPLTVHESAATHPRLHIYGTLEIRLLHHDRVILAGLNEGTWPKATRNGAFLNRTLQQQLGMASPERRTGLSAHDFQQLMGKSQVILSRSMRVDKAPTIASRWVQRMAAFLGTQIAKNIKERGQRYLQYAELLDKGHESTGKKPHPPEPRPEVKYRPTSLPVTDIETWIRDPYALYAKRILKLRPLEPLEREADPLLKGTLYHAIFEDYVSLKTMKLPPEKRLKNLVDLARNRIGNEKLNPDIALIWQLRFEEIARQFVLWESEYANAQDVKEIFKEIDGSMQLAENTFRLYARADRIDVLADGRLVVLDYKTGLSPSPSQARTLSPQMALEGAIARAGKFADISTAEIDKLAFIRLVQGEKFGLQSIADKNNSIDDIIEQAIENLQALILLYQKPETAYISRRAPFREGDMDGDYDHLARVREWSLGEGGDL